MASLKKELSELSRDEIIEKAAAEQECNEQDFTSAAHDVDLAKLKLTRALDVVLKAEVDYDDKVSRYESVMLVNNFWNGLIEKEDLGRWLALSVTIAHHYTNSCSLYHFTR